MKKIMRLNPDHEQRALRTLSHLALSLAMLLSASSALAETALDDDDLAAISGQSGLTTVVNTGSSGIAAQQVKLTVDAGNSNQAVLIADTVSMKAVDSVGTAGGSASATFTLDAASSGSTPLLNFVMSLNRSRLALTDLTISGDTAGQCSGSACSNLAVRSFGSWALDAAGQFQLSGRIDNSFASTYLLGQLNNAKLFYSQTPWLPRSYMVLNNLNAKWELSKGTVGIVNSTGYSSTTSPMTNAGGIHMATSDKSQNAIVTNTGAGPVDSTSLLNVMLDFDMLFKTPALYSTGTDTTQYFVITGNEQPMMHFGWVGSMRNAEVYWRAGGTWASGTSYYNQSNYTSGLNFATHWDFVSQADATALGDATKEFQWVLGEAAGSGADQSRVNFMLGDWTRWNPALYSHNFPLIALDVIKPGGTGVDGLCWGVTSSTCSGGLTTNLTFGYVGGFDDLASNRDTNTSVSSTGLAGGLALMIRDGNLLSYSRRVQLQERNSAGAVSYTRDFKWGLIYTFANVNANAYVYAGGNNTDPTKGSLNGGLVVDLNLMSQTFGDGATNPDGSTNATTSQGFNWSQGTHLMVADTDLNGNGTTGETRDAMGIGLIASSFLVLANDMSIRVLDETGTSSAYNPYKGGIDLMSPQARFALNTTFGGGVLPDSSGSYGTGPTTVRAARIKLNFEGLLNARLSPSAPVGAASNPCTTWGYNCKNYLGYSWAMRFMDTNIANFSENTAGYSCTTFTCANSLTTATPATGANDFGSYLSLSEPTSTGNVDLKLANITGDLTLENGVIDMVGHTEDADGKPKLRIINNMNLGAAAATRMNDAVSDRTTALGSLTAGQPFAINRIMLGNADMGQVVIPSAQIYSSITLKPQN